VDGSDGHERSRRFLQEPPDIQSRREERLERLKLVKQELQNLF